MKYLVTGTQMKQIDRFTIEKVGIPSMVLMERAALAVAKEIEKRIRPGERIWCICGTGNNGADGIAAARILYLKGYFVKLGMLWPGRKRDRRIPQPACHCKACGRAGVPLGPGKGTD